MADIDSEDVILKLTHDMAAKIYTDICKEFYTPYGMMYSDDSFDRNKMQLAWNCAEKFYQDFQGKIAGKKLDFLINLQETKKEN
jgi:hypothetical protein